ncbi:MAG: biotin--[acetyl-CoA-carboxylase] ligase, partial [Thermodesulfobacteriota bacterium]
PLIPAKDAPLLTLVSSLALAETIKNEGANPSIKWPNDIFVGGKKAAGLLTEMQPKGDRVEFVVVGIGVNLNITKELMKTDMKEIAEIATSIGEETGREVDRSAFTAALINNLEKWHEKFQMEGKNPIIQEWMKMCGTINRRVKVKFNEKEIEGIACGVDENGYLILKKDDETIESVVAGDVILL